MSTIINKYKKLITNQKTKNFFFFTPKFQNLTKHLCKASIGYVRLASNLYVIYIRNRSHTKMLNKRVPNIDPCVSRNKMFCQEL